MGNTMDKEKVGEAARKLVDAVYTVNKACVMGRTASTGELLNHEPIRTLLAEFRVISKTLNDLSDAEVYRDAQQIAAKNLKAAAFRQKKI